MTREKKTQVIDELQEVFSECSIGILTDYRGLTATQLTDLRRKLRSASVSYRVVKNSLAQFAAERAGRRDLMSSFEGPVAIASGYDDITQSAKVLMEYIRATKSILNIKGGFLSTRLLTAGDVENLSKLPPREILIGQVLAGMQSPITALVYCLVSPLRGIMGVLQARIQQLEGE